MKRQPTQSIILVLWACGMILCSGCTDIVHDSALNAIEGVLEGVFTDWITSLLPPPG